MLVAGVGSSCSEATRPRYYCRGMSGLRPDTDGSELIFSIFMLYVCLLNPLTYKKIGPTGQSGVQESVSSVRQAAHHWIPW